LPFAEAEADAEAAPADLAGPAGPVTMAFAADPNVEGSFALLVPPFASALTLVLALLCTVDGKAVQLIALPLAPVPAPPSAATKVRASGGDAKSIGLVVAAPAAATAVAGGMAATLYGCMAGGHSDGAEGEC
jgi:hypothetical protein